MFLPKGTVIEVDNYIGTITTEKDGEWADDIGVVIVSYPEGYVPESGKHKEGCALEYFTTYAGDDPNSWCLKSPYGDTSEHFALNFCPICGCKL
jgi:hypothetical protein